MMPHFSPQIPPIFLRYAADILGDTNEGLSGTEITSLCLAYAIRHGVEIPYSHSLANAPNKRTALFENIQVFMPEQQYQIIYDLCEHPKFQENKSERIRKLKLDLISKYSNDFGFPSEKEPDPSLIEETRHWLSNYADSYTHYEQALLKYKMKAFDRNALDDLRLALELLLKKVLQNRSSLENQMQNLGQFIKRKGGTAEFQNMFVKLIDYFSKYQNERVKHNYAVNEDEIEFMFELSSSFMKHIIKINQK